MLAYYGPNVKHKMRDPKKGTYGQDAEQLGSDGPSVSPVPLRLGQVAPLGLKACVPWTGGVQREMWVKISPE